MAALGYAIGTEDGKPTIETDTFTCVHCNRIVHVHIGSGRERGFCFNCGGPHCGEKRGTKDCWECVPFEARLEMWEGGRRRWRKVDLRKGVPMTRRIPILSRQCVGGLII